MGTLVHSSNPFRPSSSKGGRVQYNDTNDFLGKLESSNDPICGYDEHLVGRRRLSRRAVRLNNPDKEEDELLLFHSATQGTEIATEQSTKDGEYDDDEILRQPDSEWIPPIDFIPEEDMEYFDNVYDPEDEDNSLLTKPPEEQEEIEAEIKELYRVLPRLNEEYRIFDRLGTGTFSSVYKAIDLHYHEMDNTPWHGHHPEKSSAHYQSIRLTPVSKAYVAIKRIYVTSNPERIRNEIAILEDLRGCRHVSQLITAFRKDDQVVAIIPYQRNVDFRDFYLDLAWPGIRAYFRCLFRSLRDVHARDIIHRDVKPANFLFDPRTNTGTLCDFGLTCRIDYNEFNNTNRSCQHGIPNRKIPHGTQGDEEKLKTSLIDPRKRHLPGKSIPSERIGYPADDRRPTIKVNRAGTRGFRAPEVLLKCPEQTTAIDIWSAGVILLFFLCGRFPMFRSNDDIEALMEIALVIGRKRMERTAALHGRTFLTNIPGITNDGISWKEFCTRLNRTLYTCGPPFLQDGDISDDGSEVSDLVVEDVSESRKNQVDGAVSLLEHLLDPDSTKRYSARDALNHPWLREKAETDYDDAFFPHPILGGTCGASHYMDETNSHMIKGVAGFAHRPLVAGEGIAIGNSPCEFHSPQCILEDS